MHVGKVIVKAEFQVPYCLLKYKFLLDKKNSDRIFEEYWKKSSVPSPSPHHVGLEITVEPLRATTSRKRPPPINDRQSKTPKFSQSKPSGSNL